MSDYAKPLPSVNLDSEPFWESCRRHALTLQQCVNCRKFRYPPRPLCPECHAPDAEWQRIKGEGHVYAAVVVNHSYGPAWQDSVPYNVSLIELAEGVRIWSNVVECVPEDVRIGDRVTIVYDDVTADTTLPKFRRAE
jgi:uncharacterized OB-fold protein